MSAWGDFGEILLAAADPKIYGAVQNIKNRRAQEEALPVVAQQKDWAAQGLGSDPSFSGSEWVQGLYDTMPGAIQPNMSNPQILDAVTGFKSQAQKEGALTRLMQGTGGSTSDLSALSLGESGQHLNAIRQAKDSFLPSSSAIPSADVIKWNEYQRKIRQEAGDREALSNLDYVTREPDPSAAYNALGELSDVTNASPDFIAKNLMPRIEKLYGPDKTGANRTEEQLTAAALEGDKNAQAILDAMQKRRIETARQTRQVVVNNPMPSRMKMDFNSLTPQENMALNNAISNGLDPYRVNSRTAKIYAQQELLNPGRDWNQLGAQAAFARSPATSNTKALLNTIDPLLNKLDDAGKVLGNMRSPAGNRAVNWFKENIAGSENLTAFKNLRDDVVAEVERGLLGTGVLSDSKYNRAIKNISEAANYRQLRAAIRNTRTVIKARLESLKEGPYPEASRGGAVRQTESPRVDKSRPVNNGRVTGYRQPDGSIVDASGRRLN